MHVKVPGTAETSYPIVIGKGLLRSVWTALDERFSGSGRFVVTDANVQAAGLLSELLGSGDAPCHVIEPAGEPSKHMATVVTIVEAMEEAGLGRDSVVIALGGGTVGDIAGFAAAIFKRGVPVVQVPTTTLAQADSAIGGKTGVDSTVSKNAFGAFWHPAVVYIDVATLRTLDERQYRAGLVESLKHGLIADREYFEFIETRLDAILAREADVLEEMARRNCTIKGRVVEEDPNERNLRRILNYGHTVGHAVESASGYALLHGEAIAIGIAAAGLIERDVGLAEPGRLDRIRALLAQLGVPTRMPSGMADEKILDLLRHDKKAVDRWPRFVLLRSLGQVHCEDGQYAVPVNREKVEKALTILADGS